MSFAARFVHSTRSFHTSCILEAGMNRLARNMNKLIRGSNTVKRKWYDNNTGYKEVFPTVKSISDPSGQHGKMANRRTKVLDKLFMRSITDQMSTGYIASRLYGRNIEISRVRVTTDFQILNVYWLAKGVPDDENTSSLLNEISGLLRHELSQLCLMGRVPKIIFVKDKSFAKSVEVEMALAKVDFGEDFVPTDASHVLKSEFILNTRLDQKLIEKIKDLENDEFIDEKPIPPISEGIFGLDREKIVRRMVASLNKGKDGQKSDQAVERSSDVLRTNDRSIFPKNEMTDFQEFLKHRQIEHKKAFKAINRSLKSLDVNEEEDLEYYNYVDVEDFETELDFEIDKESDEEYKKP